MFNPQSLLAMVTLTLCGCYANDYRPETRALVTAYDYQILDRHYRPAALDTLSDSLVDADVVFVGEYHRNQASHLLEMQLLANAHRRNQARGKATVLTMEMFTREQQGIVDRYLDGDIGETYLIKEAPTWKNYQSSYRPLVEYAKTHHIAVVAANASADIVRCIGRRGSDYLTVLKPAQRSQIAQAPFAVIPGYEEKFFGYMGGAKHMSKERQRQSYQAQITRDNTMAESIAESLDRYPGSQVLHINGSFHSEDGLGTVAALRRLKPEISIKVVTPVHVDKLHAEKQEGTRSDDFYYVLQPQPEEFVDADYMKKSRSAMFAASREKAKSCEPQ